MRKTGVMMTKKAIILMKTQLDKRLNKQFTILQVESLIISTWGKYLIIRKNVFRSFDIYR